MDLTSYQKNFLSSVIAIPSIGADPLPGAPYGRNPKKALDFFLAEASREGFKTGIAGDRAGWVELGEGKRLLGIVCHLDVVPEGEGWESDPFALTIKNIPGKGDYMYGRGIIDDKGPAAASFFAMRRVLQKNNLPDDLRVRLILGSDEERTCSCVEYYADHEEIPEFSITPDAEFPAIYCEKGILHVKIKGPSVKSFSAKGGSAANMVPAKAEASISGRFLKACGKPAHASKPELGINAITELAKAMESAGFSLDDYPVMKFALDFDNLSFTGTDTEDESGKLTSNIGILKADESCCELVIDLRVPYTVKLDDVFESLARKASEYGLEAFADSKMDAVYKDKNSVQIKKLTDIWASHMDKFTGFKEEYREEYKEAMAIGGGTYARHIPNTVAFGVQAPWHEDQCHQANECVSVNDFLLWIDIIEDFITGYRSES